MLRARDLMITDLVVLRPEMGIHHAVSLLMKRDISGAPVLDQHGTVVGILTEKDCLRLLTQGRESSEIPAGIVAEYMTDQVTTMPQDMDIYYAAGMFLRHVYRRFPVVDGEGKLVGILSRSDLLHAVDHHFDDAKLYTSSTPAPPREHPKKG